ncbi:MAG: acyl-CoA/acyl-ACP dehydrogenase [Halioglobus sp.]|nr:acyl-CoA/acyl-ACP dehydrogenase [Halioglobus sp.]
MDFGFSEDQEMLRDQVRKFLDDQCPLPQVRTIAAGPQGYSPDLWKQLSELGWLGLTLPEEYGGVGLDWVDLVIILEETGRTLFPSPLVSTTLAATAINAYGTAAQRQQWLPGLASGSHIGTLALLDEIDFLSPEAIRMTATSSGDSYRLSGQKRFVQDASAADVFIVAFRSGAADSDIGLAIVPAQQSGVSVEDTPGWDRTKRTGVLTLEDVEISPDALLGGTMLGAHAVETLVDRGALAVAAEAIGVCEGILSLTSQYALDRKQFGSPIGRYQGVKHPLAEMYVDIECMKSLVYYAAWTLQGEPDEAPAAIAKAKAYASESVCSAGVNGVQLHGAIGYTDEYDMQLFIKRSKWSRATYGDEDFHYDRVATFGGL